MRITITITIPSLKKALAREKYRCTLSSRSKEAVLRVPNFWSKGCSTGRIRTTTPKKILIKSQVLPQTSITIILIAMLRPTKDLSKSSTAEIVISNSKSLLRQWKLSNKNRPKKSISKLLKPKREKKMKLRPPLFKNKKIFNSNISKNRKYIRVKLCIDSSNNSYNRHRLSCRINNSISNNHRTLVDIMHLWKWASKWVKAKSWLLR